MPSQSLHPPQSHEPPELSEEVELELDKKRRILDLFERLDELTYYELLGVPEASDKKQIKSAYYKLAPEFHPDSYFRKNLGSYKSKIEAIFTRMTLAHDVLTVKQRRAEYDEYLEQALQNRSLADALHHAEKEVRAVEEAIEQSARAVAPDEAAPSVRPSLTPDERRAILARKLTGNSFAKIAGRHRTEPPPAPVSSPVPDTPEGKRAAAEALRIRYEAAKAEAVRGRIQAYRKQAEDAILANDFAKAANAYRVASHLAPDDAELRARCDEVQKQAAATLAAGYLKQAAYEEHEARWAEAALSYGRAVEGRPDDAFAHERGAYATIKAGGSARRAVELARRAVELNGSNPDNRITLARAYLAAGFAVSALGELDRALAAGPQDMKHKQIVAELREQAHRMQKLG